jgi:hypothetical protein
VSWGYRVMRHETGEEDYFALHEVYCHPGSVEVSSWTLKPVDVGGSSIEALRWMLDRMREALEKPVLDYPTADNSVDSSGDAA